MENQIIEKIRKKVENDQLVEGKLGATMKLRRKEKEQTLEEISRKHGVSISYLSKIENNLMKPNIKHIGNILETLHINEELFSSSLIMNDWYSKLLFTIAGISDDYDELRSYTKERNDYQSKFINFALDVYNKTHIKKSTIQNLLLNVELLQPLELSIFIFSLARHYIDQKDFYLAGSLIREVKNKYFVNEIIKMWYYEILFELALYQSSFTYLNLIVKKLGRYYFTYGLLDKSDNLRKKLLYAKTYFLTPYEHLAKEFNKEHFAIYQRSLVYYQMYDKFLEIENKDKLAQLIFDNAHENNSKVKETLKYITFSDDPYEQMLEIYFKNKDSKDDLYKIFREIYFNNTGLSQHFFCMEFIANKLCEILKDKHLYKECFLVLLRLKELRKNNRLTLKHPLYH